MRVQRGKVKNSRDLKDDYVDGLITVLGRTALVRTAPPISSCKSGDRSEVGRSAVILMREFPTFVACVLASGHSVLFR